MPRGNAWDERHAARHGVARRGARGGGVDRPRGAGGPPGLAARGGVFFGTGAVGAGAGPGRGPGGAGGRAPRGSGPGGGGGGGGGGGARRARAAVRPPGMGRGGSR